MSEPTSQDQPIGLHALITVYCHSGHVAGQAIDHIVTGLHFPCPQCHEYGDPENKRWMLTTDVVRGFVTANGTFVVAPAVEDIPSNDQLGVE